MSDDHQHHNSERVDERYVSFQNIDCFENACLVIDRLLEVTKNPEYNNMYWQKIIPTIPQSYYARDRALDEDEALLYLVCANVFYLEELFEKADDKEGMAAMVACEMECC